MPKNVDGFTPLPADPGLYDQLIDQQLHDQLAKLAQSQLAPDINKVDPAELPDRVGELIGTWVSRVLSSVTPDNRMTATLALSQAVINALSLAEPDSDCAISSLTDPVSRLLAVNHLSAANTPIPIRQPLTPLRDTVLMTNARDQPSVGREIEAEIESADRIDLADAQAHRESDDISTATGTRIASR